MLVRGDGKILTTHTAHVPNKHIRADVGHKPRDGCAHTMARDELGTRPCPEVSLVHYFTESSSYPMR